MIICLVIVWSVPRGTIFNDNYIYYSLVVCIGLDVLYVFYVIISG